MGSSLQQRAESSDERKRQALLLALSESSGTAQEREILDVIADIVVTRFNGRSIRKLCAMGGITLDEFTQSVAYKEIFGQGRLEGRQEGELEIALRQLRRRCGSLSNKQVDRVRGLPQQQLEELAEALLDFRDGRDLDAWLQGLGS